MTALLDLPAGHYINGEWAGGTATFAVENPATGEVIAQVADADAEVGRRALAAAAAAQEAWARTSPRARADLLMNLFQLLHERAGQFAALITAEMGKPFAEARGEVAYSAEFFRWFAEESVRSGGAYRVAPSAARRIITMKQPVGPVLAITPWNFPLAMGARKIAPALAAGCTVVLKPAPQTPLTSLALMALLDEAGVPAGVVNCVTTSDAAAVCGPLIADPALRKLTFTGSTAVGRTLLAQAAQRVLRTSMELGGNAPFVVLADADLDKAVVGAVEAKMRNSGEACTAANRFLVHESLADEFADRLTAQLSALRVGDGMTRGTQVGPLIDANAVASVEELVDDAVRLGARVRTGGHRLAGPGYFFEPTVLTGVPAAARILRAEIFGPVAPIRTFADTAEALAEANATAAGLIGYVYGENLGRTMAFAEGLHTGMVGVNEGVISDPAAPFGGVKESGLGREGGAEGLDEYLETKYVGLAL